MKKLKITIHKDGTQTLEVLGALGGECLEFSAELEKRLGAEAAPRDLKPEFELEGEAGAMDRERERG